VKLSLPLPALALVFSGATFAVSISTPCVTINVAGQRQTICAQLGQDGKTWESNLLVEGPIVIFDDDNETPLAEITSLMFGGNLDPTLGFAIAVADFGAPSTFGFEFFTPIVGGPYTHAFATISGSVTDSASDGASVSPVLPATHMMVSTADPGAVNLGVNVGPACVGAAGVSTPCAASSLHNFAVAAAPFTSMTIALDFVGSGDGDLASFTGRLDLDTAVPEPSTWALAAAALAGLTLRRRRQQSV
jgi:MYXO-CTERM domain-containing protein